MNKFLLKNLLKTKSLVNKINMLETKFKVNETSNHQDWKLKKILIFSEYKIEEINSLIKTICLDIEYLKKKELNGEIKKDNILVSELYKEEIKKKERDPRHFAPGNKEWNNSVYTFNKNYSLSSANKDKIASNSIRSFFNMVSMPSLITKSKRMRDLIRRSSTKQLFVSKPEIKQTNDNINITVYTFDREKRLFYRKLFFLRKWLNENLMGRKLKESKYNIIKKVIKFRKTIKRSSIYKKHIIYNKKLPFRKKRNVLKRKIIKYQVNNDLHIKTTNILLNKKKYLVNIFIYRFLKNILAGLYDKKLYFIPREINKSEKTYLGEYGAFAIKKKKKYVLKTEQGRIKHLKPKDRKIFILNEKLNIKSLRSINILLLNYILFQKKNEGLINKYPLLIRNFKSKYEKVLIQKHLKKEILITNYISNIYKNSFKYYTYLPGLKSLLSRVYNKKIKFNIIKLKNIHLNSDIFSEAISIKLRKRTTSLLRILRRSFNFVKKIRPNEKYFLAQKRKNFPAKKIQTYFGNYNVINGKIINKVFKNMFNYKFSSGIKGVLNAIKYKWVSGARVEAKGRLTKRYAASRALFKYKYRGTLRNLENLGNVENYLQSPNVSMLRGDLRPNTQHSLIHSKRRIGAFGIKGWISNS